MPSGVGFRIPVASDRRAGEQGQRIVGSSAHADDPADAVEDIGRFGFGDSIDCCKL